MKHSHRCTELEADTPNPLIIWLSWKYVPFCSLHQAHSTYTKCRSTRKSWDLGIQLSSPGPLKAPQGLVNPARSPISSPSGGDPSLQAQPGSITPRRAVKWPLCVCRHVGGMGLCVGRQPLPTNNGPHIGLNTPAQGTKYKHTEIASSHRSGNTDKNKAWCSCWRCCWWLNSMAYKRYKSNTIDNLSNLVKMMQFKDICSHQISTQSFWTKRLGSTSLKTSNKRIHF